MGRVCDTDGFFIVGYTVGFLVGDADGFFVEGDAVGFLVGDADGFFVVVTKPINGCFSKSATVALFLASLVKHADRND